MLTDWIDLTVNQADCSGPLDSGHVTLRRLNRNEYRNTIRDLVGIDYVPATGFPADDVGYGFDNIGDVMSLPPLLMEKYLAAAEEISQRAIILPPAPVLDRKISDLELRGPLGRGTTQLPETHRRIFVAGPNEQTRPRRSSSTDTHSPGIRRVSPPGMPVEVTRLSKLVELAGQQGDSFEKGIQLALQAILISPHFLFRVESDPSAEQDERGLNDYELATRMSYFLWSSMPDALLFQHARHAALRKGNNLQQQVRSHAPGSQGRCLYRELRWPVAAVT